MRTQSTFVNHSWLIIFLLSSSSTYPKCLKAECVGLWSWVQSCLEIPHLYYTAGRRWY